MENPPDLSYEQFVSALRSALHYLYDAVQLRRSPLILLLWLQNEFDRAAALQQTLTGAIRALKPPNDEPPQSRAWRTYDLLSLFYLRRLPREAVANQLGISERQLRREQRLAIEVLAQQLWQQPEVAARLHLTSLTTGPTAGLAAGADELALSSPNASPGNPPEQGGPNRRNRDPAVPPEPRIPLGEALENVRSLIHPLAQQNGVVVQIYVTAEIIGLPLSPMALRTILLTVLAVAVRMAAPGAVIVTASRRGDAIAVEVTCDQPVAGDLPLADAEVEALKTAQEQAAFYAARLEIGGCTRCEFVVTLLLDAPQQTLVLVIDDNTDWLALVQRYAAGTAVQVVVTAAPESACAMAGNLQPALIVLDVMMHNVDGWQVLSELCHDPATLHIPVVVCSILPLAEMALALGADAFLQKPVSQQQFLQLLDRFGAA